MLQRILKINFQQSVCILHMVHHLLVSKIFSTNRFHKWSSNFVTNLSFSPLIECNFCTNTLTHTYYSIWNFLNHTHRTYTIFVWRFVSDYHCISISNSKVYVQACMCIWLSVSSLKFTFFFLFKNVRLDEMSRKVIQWLWPRD